MSVPSIAILDSAFPFSPKPGQNGKSSRIQPNTVSLAEAFAKLGHQTTVFGTIQTAIIAFGVDYAPLSSIKGNEAFSLVIANNDPLLFRALKKGKRLLWLHEPETSQLYSARFLLGLFLYRPHLVFSSLHHLRKFSRLLRFLSASVIPYGIHNDFFHAVPEKDLIPLPVATYSAMPPRGLGALVKLWAEQIKPHIPKARLDIFCEKNVSLGDPDPRIEEALVLARTYASAGINLLSPPPRTQMIKEILSSRLVVTFGDNEEDSDYSIAEAQCLGIPAVATNLGVSHEAIENTKTGFVADNPKDYADSVIRLLKDDVLWQEQHKAAVERRHRFSWSSIAELWKQKFLTHP